MGCGALVERSEGLVCRACQESAEPLRLALGLAARYLDTRPLTPVYGAFRYDPESIPARAVIALKHGHHREIVADLAELCEVSFNTVLDREAPLAIAAVPLHPRRQRERGFNQSELLAQRLARGWGVPVLPLLERTRHTGTQKGRGAERRRSELSGAFQLRAGMSAPARVLLVDDVCTTGATLGAAAEALYSAGVEQVRCWSVAVVE